MDPHSGSALCMSRRTPVVQKGVPFLTCSIFPPDGRTLVRKGVCRIHWPRTPQPMPADEPAGPDVRLCLGLNRRPEPRPAARRAPHGRVRRAVRGPHILQDHNPPGPRPAAAAASARRHAGSVEAGPAGPRRAAPGCAGGGAADAERPVPLHQGRIAAVRARVPAARASEQG